VYSARSQKFWNYPDYPLEEIRTNLEMRVYNRSWWYPERDDGVLLTQFTNVIQAVRIEPNWTNFFYLCRDGANSPSNRVREDSFWDLRDLASFSTDEQAQFILDDPLVDEKHKECLNSPGWRSGTRNHNPQPQP
jgi:hypothetical protein